MFCMVIYAEGGGMNYMPSVIKGFLGATWPNVLRRPLSVQLLLVNLRIPSWKKHFPLCLWMGWPLHWKQANGCRGQTIIGSLGAEDIDYPFSGFAGYSRSDRVGFFPQEVLLQSARGVVKVVEGWASDRILGSAQQPQEEKCCKLRPRPLCARFTYILWTLLLSKVCLHNMWKLLKILFFDKSSWYHRFVKAS